MDLDKNLDVAIMVVVCTMMSFYTRVFPGHVHVILHCDESLLVNNGYMCILVYILGQFNNVNYGQK